MGVDDKCGFREIQNAVHLWGYPLIGNGKGTLAEEIWVDPEWCREGTGAGTGSRSGAGWSNLHVSAHACGRHRLA